MFPVSQHYLDSLNAGFQQISVVQLWFAGSYIQDLPIADGTVTVDRSSAIRRTASITVADPSFVPQFANSPLAPYGAELYIFVGVHYQDGSEELAPVGVFRIDSVDWEEGSGNLPVLSCSDRSADITDAKLIVPRDAGGHGCIDMIYRLVTEVSNVQVAVDLSLVDFVMPGGTVYDSDRWGAITSLATALGAEVFFDVFGNVVVQAVPTIPAGIASTDAAWVISSGEGGALVNARRGVTRDNVRNCIVVFGGATSNSGGVAPVGYAVDSDPRSPTYFGPATSVPNGPFVVTNFGQSVERITMSELYTPQQCAAAAKGILANYLGFAKSLDFESLRNPALEAGDILYVAYPNGQSEFHILDQFEIPLGDGDFTGSTRTLTYQQSGGS